MPVEINVRYWTPTEPRRLGGGTQRASRLSPVGYEVKLGTFVGSDADPGVLHLTLDPDPADRVRSFSAIDITGSFDDFRALIDQLQSYVDINDPQPDGETIVVAVVRHPDSGNVIEVEVPCGAPVKVIDIDLGSSFDGEPSNEEEAETANDMADSLEREIAGLPTGGKAVSLVQQNIEELREQAAVFIKPDLDEDISAEDYRDLGLCPDCEADLTIGEKHADDCPLFLKYGDTSA